MTAVSSPRSATSSAAGPDGPRPGQRQAGLADDATPASYGDPQGDLL